MEKKEQLYEGKAKKVYATDDPDLVIVSYKDDATAFDGLKKGTIVGKGVINNQHDQPSDAACMEKAGIPTHFVEELSERETLVKKVSIVPLEVIIRNISAGHFAKRYGVEEGIVFDEPTIEFSYKNDDLHDPLHERLPRPCPEARHRGGDRDSSRRMPSRSTTCSRPSWTTAASTLVDFKLEFGKTRRRHRSSWPTRSAPTPAASGTARPTKSWTRTASAATWAAWRTPISEVMKRLHASAT